MRGDITLNHEELIICERLRTLKMSGMADAFEDQMLDPNADLMSFLERFTRIVDQEWQLRYDKKFKRYLKKAHLRYPDADIDETIYDPAMKLDTTTIERLASCHWVEEPSDHWDDQQRKDLLKQCALHLGSPADEDGQIHKG